MYGMYNPQMNIERINNQIQELERLKNGYQNMPQQAPVNIYNNAMPSQNDFKAHILNENEKVDEILVTTRTMFLDDKNGHLYIKELNGDIKEYEVVLPKDEKDLKIEELERRLNEYEQSNSTNAKIDKPDKYDNGNDEPTTKTTGSSISKQSK